MSLYLSSDANSLNGFSRNVEEQCAKLMNLREGTLNLMQHDAYRLLAELPFLFRNRVESISIRFMKRKAKGETESAEADETECGVEFEFGFDDGKLYTRILIDESQVSVSVGCDNNDTVEYLSASKVGLEERLNSYGLDLCVFSVSIHDDYLPLDQESIDMAIGVHGAATRKAIASIDERRTDEATRAQLRDIYTEGRMPALEEFSLNVSNQDLDAVNGIPEQLYCAMACFFAQLYETELN
ncbi:MAG: hypothetical protein DHS20C12_00240 [Pseudohongiella sp.]|nr:MAG: hypothetical protein DHS20C12_00240 [Pseudohongiella sp.]